MKEVTRNMTNGWVDGKTHHHPTYGKIAQDLHAPLFNSMRRTFNALLEAMR